ncbi:MAG: UDP-N-acetylmuramate--L-alanine ligase [Crocinitomicaceae bacterium]|nr:UDP-N-acetylmuramate--L-alanine ligase [Crocinitomicaceae bacterium]
MRLEEVKYCYLLGIGGIGMSALARYFHANGIFVEGYDKTPTPLTDELQREGIVVRFQDRGARVVHPQFSLSETLVIYTPAIPKDHGEWNYFKNNGYTLSKRAEVLGMITHHQRSYAVAGTHGKTTTSTLLAHVFKATGFGCSAFLGGISSNYHTNLLLDTSSGNCVVEADEFDRSFLHLSPYAATVTSTDADHLDIYGEATELKQAFQEFAERIDADGYLVVHHTIKMGSKCAQVAYGISETPVEELAVCGYNLRYEQERFLMDVTAFGNEYFSVEIGIPGTHNAENALAVIGIGLQEKIPFEKIVAALASFKGVKRRFEFHIKTEQYIYIDDYAHHPTAIHYLIESVRLMFPKKKITGVFQPHLFSRTCNFMDEFAQELSALDEVILMPIYPARELPIPGVTSDALLTKITVSKKQLLSPDEVLTFVQSFEEGVLLTIGAGDIDRLVEPIKTALS